VIGFVGFHEPLAPTRIVLNGVQLSARNRHLATGKFPELTRPTHQQLPPWIGVQRRSAGDFLEGLPGGDHTMANV